MDPLTLSGILGIGGKIIDRLFPDPEESARAKMELIRMQQEGELREAEVQLSAILAEAKSSDPWTSRARPSFLYVMYIMILAAVPMGIVSAVSPDTATAVAKGMGAWLMAIPDGMWATFGIGYTGYAYFRSRDKHTVHGGRN